MDRYNDGREGGAGDATGEPASARPSGQAAGRPAEKDPWLSELRRMLETSETTPSIGDAAEQMGMSMRTLQRHLHRVGTSYRKELRAARRAAAPEGPKRAGPPGTALLLVGLSVYPPVAIITAPIAGLAVAPSPIGGPCQGDAATPGVTPLRGGPSGALRLGPPSCFEAARRATGP
jgi:hypothetical protein